MIRFFIRLAIFLGTALLGLVLAALILLDVQLSPTGAIAAVVVFALAQSILAPFIFNLALSHMERVIVTSVPYQIHRGKQAGTSENALSVETPSGVWDEALTSSLNIPEAPTA